jgi:adenylate cyclase
LTLATHYSLALWALWLPRSLRMPVAEAAQLVLGFSIPFFLVDHVLQTRVGDTFYDAHYGHYSTVLHAYFVVNPLRGGLQLMVLVIAWVHAMIGLWFWLRLKPWYPRWQSILFAFALLMPTFAILGFFEGRREAMAMAADPDWAARLAQAYPRAAATGLFSRVRDGRPGLACVEVRATSAGLLAYACTQTSRAILPVPPVPLQFVRELSDPRRGSFASGSRAPQPPS